MLGWSVLVCVALGGGLLGCAKSGDEEPEVVATLDLQRYAGTWFEIASVPVSAQEGCMGTQATYGLEGRGRFSVINVCHDGVGGEVRRVNGTAWMRDPEEPGKLQVQFLWPFRGNYWVLELDPDYEWALVGTPDRKHAWILSRSPRLDEEIVGRLVTRLRLDDYPIDRLRRTPHPSG